MDRFRVRTEHIRTSGPWLALVLLFALALRLYRIDVQSLWADEGTSVALAPRSLEQIASDASHDIHPPLYYWTLHFWVRLMGRSVVAVRALSALYGTLVVALTYGLARRWFGTWAAAVAAVAAAVSPFAVHYSQETRMYILVTLFGALTWLAFDRWLAQPTGRWLILYGLAALATLYTHYFGAAIIVAINLAWLVVFLTFARRWRASGTPLFSPAVWKPAASWVAVQALLAAGYLPWLWYSRGSLLSWPAIGEPLDPLVMLRDTMRVFSLGPNAVSGWPVWLGVFLLLLAVGLLKRPQRHGLPDGRLLAGAWLFVPLGLMLLLSLDRPFYNPKFLLLALPAFHVLIGHGAVALGERLHAPRLAALAASGCLVLAAREPLRQEWFNPAVWRDDYRGIARTVTATAAPDDAILLLGPGQIEIFDYYYRGSLPRYPLPRQRPLDPDTTVQELEAIARRHGQLYAVLWAQGESDPQGVVEGWLEANAFKASDRWYGTVRLAIFKFGDLSTALKPVGARFGPHVWLDRAAVDPLVVRAGEVMRIAAEWHADALPVPEGSRQLRVFAQLLDDSNHIVGQYDGSPAVEPSSTWPARVPRRGQFGLPVLPGTPPGTYRLIVGLYDAWTMARLPLPDGTDALTLASIRVERPSVPPTVDSLDTAVRRLVPLGHVHLLGWRFNKLGFDSVPETPLRPGEPLSVVLFWKAMAGAPTVPPLTLQLIAPSDQTIAEQPWTPTEGRYAPKWWEAGEVVRDPQVYFIPGNLAPGRYQLALSDGQQRIVLGTLQIER